MTTMTIFKSFFSFSVLPTEKLLHLVLCMRATLAMVPRTCVHPEETIPFSRQVAET